jgi:hypothetical protein
MARAALERSVAIGWEGTVCVYQIEWAPRLLWFLEAMICTLEKTRPSQAVGSVLLAWLALAACGAQIAAAAPPLQGGAGHARHGHRGGASSYPAAATRPTLYPRPSEFAHVASSGGASAPSAGRGAPGKKPASRKPARKALRGNPARALVAFEAMQKQFYVPGSGLYQGEPFSYLWPFSQALAATVSMANIQHLGTFMRRELSVRIYGLRSYLDLDNSGSSEGTFTSTLAAYDGTVTPPTGPGGTKYYDDNDWVGIELVRMFKLTHEPTLLGTAEAIMAFEMQGWQTDPQLGCPGGLPFDNEPSNTDRNTVTTAPAVELAVQLYQLTHNAQYLQFAQMAYQWVRACLLQPSELYADHVNRSGVVEPALWSYNQGAMIGAGTLLYQVTGNVGYLAQARGTAGAALAYFTPERLFAENPFFPSVYLRNLLYLDSVTHERSGVAVAQNYVNSAWLNQRLGDNVFVFGLPPSTQLLYQAAVVQVYALLSSPASTYF